MKRVVERGHREWQYYYERGHDLGRVWRQAGGHSIGWILGRVGGSNVYEVTNGCFYISINIWFVCTWIREGLRVGF